MAALPTRTNDYARTPLPAAVVCRFLAFGEGDVCARRDIAKKLWMNEAINHRHDYGDDHNGDHKQHQATPCSHVLAHGTSSHLAQPA
jgi:hypothetical protein